MSKDHAGESVHLPFTLFPSPYSYSHFKKVFDLQIHINKLIYEIGNKYEILDKIFSK